VWMRYGTGPYDDLPIYYEPDALNRNDIRAWQWEEGVRLALDNLWRFLPYNTSRVIINGIKRSKQRLLIRPQSAGEEPITLPAFFFFDPSDPSNRAILSNRTEAAAQAATPAKRPVVTKNGVQIFRWDYDPLPPAIPLLGTGNGSGAVIYFTPQDYRTNVQPGGSPDEVLLHEMTHALQMMSGKWAWRAVPPRDLPPDLPAPRQRLRFDNIREFLAVIIANIYRSEQGNRPGLRTDHHGFQPLSQWVDSKEFYFLFRDELDELRDLLPFLFAHVAQVQCRFNPIRYYLERKMNFFGDSDLAAYESSMNKLEASAPP
jgi:hypothetical protein